LYELKYFLWALRNAVAIVVVVWQAARLLRTIFQKMQLLNTSRRLAHN
jgi:hypothetical protein